MSHSSVRRVIAGVLACLGVAAAVVALDAPGHAELPGAVGKISYFLPQAPGICCSANADGSAATPLASGCGGGRWSPDGSRFAYKGIWAVGIWTVRADGSAPTQLTIPWTDSDPAWSADGRFVVFSRSGSLMYVPTDGAGLSPVAFNENSNTTLYTDRYPTVSVDDDIVFERDTASGGSTIYKFNSADPANPTLLVAKGVTPDFSPDGTKIAYVVPDGTAFGNQIWISNADGTNPVQLTNDPDGAINPAWSPDGTRILYNEWTNPGNEPLVQINVDTKAVTPISSNGSLPSWQPVRQNQVYRVWGNDGTDTAIATSRWNYADAGAADPKRVPAHAVVLTRSDTYLDALAGSALAIDKQAPLLITAPASRVEPRVLAEITRVLGTSGTIYMLGGTLALPQAMQDQLTGLGYTVSRLWGATHYDTAIAIDHAITDNPTVAIVATGDNYYDALAAGAAAGQVPGGVVVLTNGSSMPAVSAGYLNSLNPDPDTSTTIVTAGGPGDAALRGAANGGQLPSWPKNSPFWSLVGNNEKDTALMLAQFFFAAPTVAAIATNRGWQDALTGGAMIGAYGGPLLTTDPTTLYGPLADYLSADSGAMERTVMLGGYLALPDPLIQPIGTAIGLPGQFTYSGTPNAFSATSRGLSPNARTTPKATIGNQASRVLPGLSRTRPSTLGD